MTEPLTQQQITELRELYEQTTPGDWNYDDDSENVVSSEFHNGEHLEWTVVESPALPVGAKDNCQVSNGLFIAAAHNAMPALLETLAERDAEVEQVKESYRTRALEFEKATIAALDDLRAELQQANERVAAIKDGRCPYHPWMAIPERTGQPK